MSVTNVRVGCISAIVHVCLSPCPRATKPAFATIQAASDVTGVGAMVPTPARKNREPDPHRRNCGLIVRVIELTIALTQDQKQVLREDMLADFRIIGKKAAVVLTTGCQTLVMN